MEIDERYGQRKRFFLQRDFFFTSSHADTSMVIDGMTSIHRQDGSSNDVSTNTREDQPRSQPTQPPVHLYHNLEHHLFDFPLPAKRPPAGTHQKGNSNNEASNLRSSALRDPRVGDYQISLRSCLRTGGPRDRPTTIPTCCGVLPISCRGKGRSAMRDIADRSQHPIQWGAGRILLRSGADLCRRLKAFV